MTRQIDYAEYINWILTIALIVVIAFAVQQRFFEDNKCNEWAKERTFRINQGIDDYEYNCTILCANKILAEGFLNANNQLGGSP